MLAEAADFDARYGIALSSTFYSRIREVHPDEGKIVNEVKASCHCGAVTLLVQHAPREVTKCNCSLCSKYGALWAYLSSAEVTINPAEAPTHVYAWNGKHIDFHRCANCGCITHWVPRDGRDRRGINARLFEPQVLLSAKITRRDGAGTGVFTE